MRLNDLKRIVAEIEANTLPENPNPDITFWITRMPELLQAKPKESTAFIEMKVLESAPMAEHRVNQGSMSVVQQVGDFTIPVFSVPFYS